VLLNGAPHPNAAKVLLNWWIDEPGQKFEAGVGVWPSRADVPLKEDWQNGVTHPKQRFTNLDVPDDAVLAGQKEAASLFKK
jgi:ABC-type glycerol-3-phosphate transport system substrate-binding protein